MIQTSTTVPTAGVVRERLRAEWAAVKRSPPVHRWTWLASPVAILALGAAMTRKLSKELSAERERVRLEAPSSAAYEAWWFGGQSLPDGLVMSRVSGRRYPEPAIAVEDELDALDAFGAARYQWPASPSASVIIKIGESRAKEIDVTARAAARRNEWQRSRKAAG